MEEIQVAIYLFEKEKTEIIRMSFADMNFIDKIVWEIKTYTDQLTKLQKKFTLQILITTLKELKGGYDTHS